MNGIEIFNKECVKLHNNKGIDLERHEDDDKIWVTAWNDTKPLITYYKQLTLGYSMSALY